MPVRHLLVSMRYLKKLQLLPRCSARCKPTGMPTSVNPHGIEIVGSANRLNGLVFRHNTASLAITSSNVDGSSLAFGGGTGVVGVNTASMFLKTSEQFDDFAQDSIWLRYRSPGRCSRPVVALTAFPAGKAQACLHACRMVGIGLGLNHRSPQALWHSHLLDLGAELREDRYGTVHDLSDLRVETLEERLI